jgi:dipeptidyl aminopeptidase/acylaminoacyl peptidase
MNADGSDARELVPAGDDQHYLRWCPGDARLAFVTRAEEGFEFVSIKPDGSDRRPLLPERAPRPELVPVVWSPDGRLVAYSSRMIQDAQPSVVVVDAASGELLGQVPGPERTSSPDFSPDGTRLLYLSKDAIWVADARGQGGHPIVEGTRASFPIDPSWSPDGGLILYAMNREQTCELWTVRPDGAERKRLYASPVRLFYPDWSPPGDRILMAVRQTDTWDLWLYTVDRDGENLVRMVGEDSGAPIFELLGAYVISRQVWAKPGDPPQTQTGSSTWSRALGGIVVRENWNIDTGRRPFVGELSITRIASNRYEAVQLNEWTGEQQHFTGVWDAGERTLTLDRVLPDVAGLASRRGFMRWIYRFEKDGSFRKDTLVGDPKGELVRQSADAYVKRPE